MKTTISNRSINFLEKVEYPALCSSIAEENDLNEIEDPFYVCDISDVVRKFDLWHSCLPRVEPFYAVKCNPHPLLLQMMASLGLSFDCASQTEISEILKLGVSASKIIYANPCKQKSHIKYASSRGVKVMTCDSVSEVVKIHEVFPDASLVIRIFVETSTSRCPLGLKFGASEKETRLMLEKASQLGMNIVGVSFHVGSGCTDAKVYGEAIKSSKLVFQLAKAYGYEMNLLDIGGGYPGDLENQCNRQLFSDVCSVINKSLDEHFSLDSADGRRVTVIAEPGRFFVSSAFQLCCSVTSVKGCDVGTNSQDISLKNVCNYYLNDGVYGSFNCVIFDHYVPDFYPLPSSRKSAKDASSLTTVTRSSVFWGPTCDSMDKICEDVTFPVLEPGDKIVFSDMGAYTMAAGCTFNGFQRPEIHFCVPREYWDLMPRLLGVEMPVDESQTYSDDSTHFEEDASIVLADVKHWIDSCSSVVETFSSPTVDVMGDVPFGLLESDAEMLSATTD